MDAPWRSDPALLGRFHPEHPDDLQVVVHDGGPRFTKVPPELMWVRVSGTRGGAYVGTLLNQPQGLASVSAGDEILFVCPPGTERPFRTSQKYLAERKDWDVAPCNKCGFGELFDAPSDVSPARFSRPSGGPDAGNDDGVLPPVRWRLGAFAKGARRPRYRRRDREA
jgi:hypothetical protein